MNKRDLLVAFVLGAFSSVVLLACAVMGIVPPALDILLLPGSTVAEAIFGGLHGIEPLFTAMVADALVWGAVFAFLAFVRQMLRS
jgi:hypothetical protein